MNKLSLVLCELTLEILLIVLSGFLFFSQQSKAFRWVVWT